MAQITVKDAAGVNTAVEMPNANGRAAEAASRPVALSTEDLAVLTDMRDDIADIIADTDPVTVITAGAVVNPASILTRPANTTAYSANDLVASSTTAGSVSVPSFTAARDVAGSFLIRRARLVTNKTSGMAAISVRIRFWSAAPTYTNGDNGAYAVVTGAAGYLGAMDITTWQQYGDGAVAIGIPLTGAEIGVKLASGQSVYWDLEILSALTPASAQTFTLIPEIHQN